jgi:prepilin-type processing-associated H-X9-DG protein
LVPDGLSNTYLIGEKYLNPDYYETGQDGADDQNAYVGYDGDTDRCTQLGYPPAQDQPGLGDNDAFGSPHAAAFNAAFCDGSVHPIPYTIDLEVHRRLGNRNDGQVIDVKNL